MWNKNNRIGTIRRTDKNEKILKELFYGKIIQEDSSGTQHWELLRVPQMKEIKNLDFEKWLTNEVFAYNNVVA